MATVRWTVATAVAFPQESESWPTTSKKEKRYGGLAQLGERLPCKQEVSGSIPLISTTFKELTEVSTKVEASLSLLKAQYVP